MKKDGIEREKKKRRFFYALFGKMPAYVSCMYSEDG